jgi:hypothetical protein
MWNNKSFILGAILHAPFGAPLSNQSVLKQDWLRPVIRLLKAVYESIIKLLKLL